VPTAELTNSGRPLEPASSECPEPGVYEGVSFETYRSWQAMNAGTLVEGLVSMRRLRAKLDGLLPDSDSPSMRFGRAVHARLLEPDEFVTRFPTVTKCQAKTEKGGDCRNLGRFLDDAGWWCGTHKPDEAWEPADFITEDEADRIERIKASAFAHREIREIRRFKGAEVSIVFDLCGVRCKARLDKLIRDGGGFVLDVKTFGKPITEAAWQRQVVDLAYHLKASFYLSAVKAATGLAADFWHIVCETSPPFDVAAIRLTDFDRQVGTFEVKRLLESYRRCCESGEWPGAYPELVTHVGLPAWKAKEYASVELTDDN
jgi:exodeoxyribonuclease VIII